MFTREPLESNGNETPRFWSFIIGRIAAHPDRDRDLFTAATMAGERACMHACAKFQRSMFFIATKKKNTAVGKGNVTTFSPEFIATRLLRVMWALVSPNSGAVEIPNLFLEFLFYVQYNAYMQLPS